jgi:ribonucleoside-diphosphate reductase beta chain
MNNEFQKLIKQAETSFKFVSESDSLETVKERYTSFELIRSQLIDWINSNLAYDDALYNEYMNRLGKAEYNYFEKYNGIPVFDDSFSEGGIENIFEVNQTLLETTEWFDDEILTTKHTDFFNKRSINYSKKSKSITMNDLF